MLPPKQQTAIILYYLHGYSLAESAEIAGLQRRHHEVALHYALKALRSDSRTSGASPGAPPPAERVDEAMTCRRGSAASCSG